MQHIFYFILIIYGSFGVVDISAQDKIMLVNGDSIVGTVVNVSSSGIKYSFPGIGDSLFFISQSVVKKIVFANGKVAFIDHTQAFKSIETDSHASKFITIKDSKYYYHDTLLSLNDLKKLFLATPDSLLHEEFSKSMKIRENSKFFMSYALVPLEVAGIALVFIPTLPTNLNDPYRKKTELGNKNLATPGFLLM